MNVHVEFTKLAAPFAGLPQTLPQAPQLVRLFLVSMHAPLHSVCPDGQSFWQPVVVHTWPTGQTSPHLPQFLGSLLRSAQPPVHL